MPKGLTRFNHHDPVQKLTEQLEQTVASGSKLFVGIDCGVTGAIAFLPTDRNITPLVVDIPITKVEKRKASKGVSKTGIRTFSLFNYARLCELLDPLVDQRAVVAVAIERGWPRPTDRPKTAFSVGAGSHIWQVYFTAFAISYEEISPSSWKVKMGLGGEDKNASRVMATRLFPDATDYFRCAGDHNRAEAILLAEFLHRRHGGAE